MYRVKNNRELLRHFLAKAGNANVLISHLESAAGFIEAYGNQALHWQTASVAVESADRDPKLVEHATASLENALATDGMLLSM